MKTNYDFVKNVTVIYDDNDDIVGHIKLGIDMVEYGGGDWDEEITYSPDFTVLSHDNVSDDIIQDVIDFIKNEVDYDEYGKDLDYEAGE